MDASSDRELVSKLVRDAPIPLVLVDLRTRTVAEVSEPMVELVGRARERIVGRLAFECSADAAATGEILDLVESNVLDGYQTTRAIRRGDGGTTPVTVWARVLDPEGGRTHLLAQFGAAPERDGTPATTVQGPAVIGVVDADWRVVTVSTDIEELVGVTSEELTGRVALWGVHRSDHADLLLAVASMLAERRGVVTRLRVRHRDGRWIRVRVQMSLIEGGSCPNYGFAMSPEPIGSVDSTPLEGHLRRIALEVRAAGVGRALHDDAFDIPLPVVEGLTNRQWEVLHRVLNGARVSSIARELYLSESTVRGHLAAIFERVGVSSQAELLERFGRGAERRSA